MPQIPTLILLGRPVQAPVTSYAEKTSALSDRQLRTISTHFGRLAPNADTEQLITELQSARDGKEPILGADGDRWRVASVTTMESNGRVVVEADFEEYDVAELSRVEIKEVSIVPTRTSAVVSSRGLDSITFGSDLDEEQHAAFEALIDWWKRREGDDRFIDVTFSGVPSGRMRVRFGRDFWKPLDNGLVGHVTTLVAEHTTDSAFVEAIANIHEPQLGRGLAQGVKANAKLQVLIEELVAAGVLSEDAAKRVEEAAVPAALSRDLDRVDDLDWYLEGGTEEAV